MEFARELIRSRDDGARLVVVSMYVCSVVVVVVDVVSETVVESGEDGNIPHPLRTTRVQTISSTE